MAAPFDRAWTRQPGLVVGICPELKPFSCYLPSAGNIDCQGKGTWTTLPKSQNFGEVFGVWNSGSAGVWHANSDAVVPAGSQATIVFVVSGINYASTASCVFTGTSSPGSGAGEFNAYCPYGGDNRTYFRWGGATEGVTSLSFADPIGNAALARHVYVLSVGPAGMAIYRDGAKLASNTATPTRSAYAVPLSLDQRTENFSLFATLSIQLPDSLNVGLSKNPWQLFAPLRRPIFSGFAAGGGTSALVLSANTTSAAAILKAAKAQRQTSTTAAAAIAKAAVSSKAAAVTSSATLARSAKLTRSATAVASAAVSKLAAAMRSASTTGSATLGTIKAKLLTLTASVTSSTTVRRAIGATRSATTTATVQVSRAVSATRAATTITAGVLRKLIGSTKTASSTLLGMLSSLSIPFGGGSFVPSLRRMFSPNRDKAFDSPDRSVTMASPDRTTTLVSPARDEI